MQGSLESVEATCKVCGSHEEEEEEAGCDESVAANGSTSCSCPDNTKQGKNARRPGGLCFFKPSELCFLNPKHFHSLFLRCFFVGIITSLLHFYVLALFTEYAME